MRTDDEYWPVSSLKSSESVVLTWLIPNFLFQFCFIGFILLALEYQLVMMVGQTNPQNLVRKQLICSIL